MKKPSKTYTFGRNEIFIVFLLLVFSSLLIFSVGVMIGKKLLENECRLILEDGQQKLELCESEKAAGKLSSNKKADTASEITEPEEIKAADVKPKEIKAADNRIAEAKVAEPKAAKHEEVKQQQIKSLPKEVKSAAAEQPPVPEDKANAATETPPPSLGIKGVNSDIRGKYTVQVSAYKDELEAQQMAFKLYNLGYKTAYYIEVELPNKGLWYRVGIGFFDKKNTADIIGEMLRKKNVISSYIIRKVE